MILCGLTEGGKGFRIIIFYIFGLGLPSNKVQNVEYIVSVRGTVQLKYESIIQDQEVKQTKTQAKSKPSKHISYPMEVAINWANLKGLSILQTSPKV